MCLCGSRKLTSRVERKDKHRISRENFLISYYFGEINTNNNIYYSNSETQVLYKSKRFLAYFQAYTNTWVPLENLIPLYEEALKHPKIEGLVIPTRPVGISCQANQKRDGQRKHLPKTKWHRIAPTPYFSSSFLKREANLWYFQL